MKQIIVTFLLIFVTSFAFAQEKEPTFEKQDDLVKATYYFDNGAVKEVGYFKGDKLHSKWISYNKKGEKITVANYNMGKKDGTWYIVQNDSVKKLIYKDNKLIDVENTQGSNLPFI